MPIQNVELISIEGKRFVKRGEPIRQLNINSNSSITLVNQIDEGTAEVEFRYTVNYTSVGFIKIEGRMVFEGEAASLVADWSAKRNMPEDIAQELHGAIMSACIPESVVLARDLSLTLPIPLPKIDFKKTKGDKGTHMEGIEVA